MPLPLIIGAAALATAAYGAKKGYDGYQKHSEADEIVRGAKHRYERKKSEFDDQEKDTSYALEMLGRKELDIGVSLGEFKTLADDLLRQLNEERQDKLVVRLPKHELNRIEEYSFTAVGVLGTVAGAGAAGAAAGFAVYGGVMAVGVASTGTAISTLAGAAATKATLAAIGGGSLAAGGMGVAGGMAILGAAVTAPVLAIAGWAYDSHGDEALRNARKADREVDEIIVKLDKAMAQLGVTEDYARRVKRALASIYGKFMEYFDSLKDINSFLEDVKGRNVDVDSELSKFNDEIFRIIENGYALAAILVDLITTPLFKVKTQDGNVIVDESGVPVMELDEDGSMILNESELFDAISESKDKASEIEAV